MSDASHNVKAMTTETAATIEEAKAWITGMAEKGYYPSSTARFRVSAIDSLCSILGPDEPRTVRWILDHLDEIGRRWATLKSSPSTAGTYLSRARGGLEDYLDFLKDPVVFKPRRRSGEGERKERAGRQEKQPSPPSDTVSTASGPAAPASARPSTTWRTYPIGDAGEAIEYRVPDTFSVRDALKFAIHLATLAKDFDPTSAVGAKVFALVRTEEP